MFLFHSVRTQVLTLNVVIQNSHELYTAETCSASCMGYTVTYQLVRALATALPRVFTRCITDFKTHVSTRFVSDKQGATLI